VFGRRATLDDFSVLVNDRQKKFHQYGTVTGFENFPQLEKVLPNDLFVFLNARKQTLSYDYNVDEMARKLNKQHEFTSFVVFYPEISKALQEGTIGEISSAPIGPRYAQVKNLTGKISHMFRKEEEMPDDSEDNEPPPHDNPTQ
jgi:hypothetical protein